MPFCSIEDAIEEIRNGRFIIVLDDENRENEGDLMMSQRRSRLKPSTSWPAMAAA